MEFAALALPFALGVIMFGLGLDLTPGDFGRVAKAPRAAVIALACQLLALPVLCFGLVLLFRLPPLLAVGMMLLAASPGGTAANLYSHLFRGDVALNISLTAINSVIAVITLPVITNLAIQIFQPGDLTVGLQFRKTLEVFLIVLVPVALGMTVRAIRPGFARAMDKPVRIASIVILAIVVIGAAASSLDLLTANVLRLGGVATAFCLLSLGIGYAVPRLLKIEKPQAVATAFEVGIHNATLAIVVAQSVLAQPEMALPAAVYGILMFPLAAVFGMIVTRQRAAA
ncbi:bile acid:sodium symporter family protein [Brevundimonas sp.]|uniref:bile acid:sodium symporter family protein n=1 Tax=Brevundimonas sp. TaxID=1871086 RepID=UPI003F7289D3